MRGSGGRGDKFWWTSFHCSLQIPVEILGLRGKINEYGYQEAAGVLNIEAMHEEGKAKEND